MDAAAVHEAVDPLARLLRADGADLVLDLVDAGQDLIRLRVELGAAACVECVLPPAQLAEVIGEALRETCGTEFELELLDPRGAVRRLVA
jgi:hypothetical protein